MADLATQEATNSHPYRIAISNTQELTTHMQQRFFKNGQNVAKDACTHHAKAVCSIVCAQMRRHKLNLLTLMATCLIALASCTTQSAQQSATVAAHTDNTALAADPNALAAHPRTRRFNELFLEAMRQKAQEKIDAEFELLQAALAIDPYAAEALYEMAVLKLSFTTYSDTLSRTEGDSLLMRATELEPSNLYYKETLATYLANSARYREAIRLDEEIADAHTTYETLATLIWLYKVSGDYAGAIRTIERLEQFDGRSEQLSMEKFQTYLAMKDDEHAYQAIEDLCAEYPLDLRYRVLLGDLYDEHGHHEQALDIYRDVLSAEPDNSYAQMSLLAYYKAAQADSLYYDFLQKVVLNPHTQESARVEAMRSYAVDNIKQQQPQQPVINLFMRVLAQPQDSRDMAELYAYYAVEKNMPTDSVASAMRRILTIEPDYTKARLQLLQLTLQGGNMDSVAVLCREGELYDPAEVTFYYYEGAALYRTGHDREALHALQRGVERIDDSTDKQLSSDIYAMLGDVLHDAHINEEAYLAYDRALQYNDANLLCLNNYAYFLAEDGKRLSEAERMSRATVDAEADNATYLDTYAWVLYKQEQYEQARIYINEALRYTDETAENASIFDHAGDIFYRCGDRAGAVDLWKRALTLTQEPAQKKVIQRKVRLRRI